MSFEPPAGVKVSGGVSACAGPPSTASWSECVSVVFPEASVWSMPSPSSTVYGLPVEIVSDFLPEASRTRIEVVDVWPEVVPG